MKTSWVVGLIAIRGVRVESCVRGGRTWEESTGKS